MTCINIFQRKSHNSSLIRMRRVNKMNISDGIASVSDIRGTHQLHEMEMQ